METRIITSDDYEWLAKEIDSLKTKGYSISAPQFTTVVKPMHRELVSFSYCHVVATK